MSSGFIGIRPAGNGKSNTVAAVVETCVFLSAILEREQIPLVTVFVRLWSREGEPADLCEERSRYIGVRLPFRFVGQKLLQK